MIETLTEITPALLSWAMEIVTEEDPIANPDRQAHPLIMEYSVAAWETNRCPVFNTRHGILYVVVYADRDHFH